MKKLFFAAITLLMVACSQEQVVLPEPELPTSSTRSTRIPLKDALKVADRMIRAIEPEGTRSTARTVESVEFFGGSSTRGGDEDPLYYVVNYANDEGFAVLGADIRVDSIYAFSDEGHLDMNDTTFNEGLDIFFDYLSVVPPNRPTVPIDSTIHIFQPIEEIEIDLSYQYGPFLTSAVRNWRQDDPYNTFCPRFPVKHYDEILGNIIIMKPALVGCSNIAIGQIMSYYECPKEYGSHVFDWQEMKAWTPEIKTYSPLVYYPAPEDGVARLLRELGTEGNMNTSYGLSKSSTNTKKYYKRTFQTFGYEEPADFDTFSTETLASYMERSKPVLVTGRKNNGDGHLWVVDGIYCDLYRYSNNLGESYLTGQGKFFHVVWGWGGACNGYFKHGSGFTEHSNQFIDENDPQSWNSDWDEYVKLYKMEFCGEISPR